MSEPKPTYLPVLTDEQLLALLAAIQVVKEQGFGKVIVVISNGKVHLLETSISTNIRPVAIE